MTRLFVQLGFEGFALAAFETVYMTVISTLIAYVIGLPLGILLCVTDRGGIKPIVWLNKIIGVIVNIFRSIPFIILMVAFIPVSRAIIGTSIGNSAVIFMLTVAAAPYVARMVESSIKEVDKGVIEAARSMGANTFQIIWKVYLPEAKPSLIVGAVISTVTVIGYSAMAGTLAGGGLGKLAVTDARPSNAQDVIWLCVALMVIIVQIIQEGGMLLAKRLDKRLHLSSRIRRRALAGASETPDGGTLNSDANVEEYSPLQDEPPRLLDTLDPPCADKQSSTADLHGLEDKPDPPFTSDASLVQEEDNLTQCSPPDDAKCVPVSQNQQNSALTAADDIDN